MDRHRPAPRFVLMKPEEGIGVRAARAGVSVTRSGRDKLGQDQGMAALLCRFRNGVDLW